LKLGDSTCVTSSCYQFVTMCTGSKQGLIPSVFSMLPVRCAQELILFFFSFILPTCPVSEVGVRAMCEPFSVSYGKWHRLVVGIVPFTT
jgi:hypothetical protein